jgi:hypothetical protein
MPAAITETYPAFAADILASFCLFDPNPAGGTFLISQPLHLPLFLRLDAGARMAKV